MKVLWLCNIMLPAVAEYLNMKASNKEGWISGLLSVVMDRQEENGIELAVAFPAAEELHLQVPVGKGMLACYGFVGRYPSAPHRYDPSLEGQLRSITEDFHPDLVHCFGTEYPHTLAMCRVFPHKDRLLLGIQGVCSDIAKAYFASMPQSAIHRVTLRDFLRRDSLLAQQKKFEKRGEMEIEAIKLAGNVTGRTDWDLHYTRKWNPKAVYYPMNETLRSNFYSGSWEESECEPHSIFLSQGDYPLKGLHYMLLALPKIREKYPDVKVYVAGNDLTRAGSLKQRLKLSAYGKYLRKLIKNYQLESCVCFLGRLDAEAMKKQYLNSSLFVCCSSVENSPNSLGEAMLLGMPCVSADVGGIPSIFTDKEDGILYPGYRITENEFNNACNSKITAGTELEKIVNNLVEAIFEMWSDPAKIRDYCKNARNHAKKSHDREANYQKMMEIYASVISGAEGENKAPEELTQPLLLFVSNYINHHQIPFCNALYEQLGGRYLFIQTEPMEEERKRMGWQDGEKLPYVRYYYEEPEQCKAWIDAAAVVLFGGTDEESYIKPRLEAGKPVIRYHERLYKQGQWKAISPRGLIQKYKDHTKYRKQNVYMLCAGAYVPSDFHIVRAYPGRMLRWGYFPETRHYDVDRLMNGKKPAHILWAARFIDWKHPELPLKAARYLKDNRCNFHLDMVGGGELEGNVKKMLEEYGLSDCVSLLGYRTPAEVRTLMEGAEIFLLTSDRQEGWGAVVNEAMNSGCAVVADHMAGAVPFLIRHGENGFIYRDGDEKELFHILQKLLIDRDLCRRAGEAAYRTITEEWNSETAALRLLGLCVREGFLREEYVLAASDRVSFEAQQNPVSGPGSPAPVIPERKMYDALRRERR